MLTMRAVYQIICCCLCQCARPGLAESMIGFDPTGSLSYAIYTDVLHTELLMVLPALVAHNYFLSQSNLVHVKFVISYLGLILCGSDGIMSNLNSDGIISAIFINCNKLCYILLLPNRLLAMELKEDNALGLLEFWG